jgi:diguanylate cyclase (GGDEF)-like protein
MLLFILCSLLPVTGLAVISFTHVTSHLYDQSQTRLHQTSKAIGMAIYERLMLVEAEMGVVASRLDSTADGPLMESLGPFIPTLSPRYKGLVVKREGTTQIIFGQLNPPSEETQAEQKHIREGKTLLTVRYEGDGPAHVFMSRLLDHDRPERGIFQAEINGGYLWFGNEDVTLPTLTELCVFDDKLRPLFCSFDKPVTLISDLHTFISPSAPSYFEWRDGTEGYLAGFWSLPLRFRFSQPQWTVVLSEPKSGALAPLESFKWTFVLVIILTLCVVTLLSVNQIRSSLDPLGKLDEATKRIAERDFASRVSITRGDEFGALARSFNAMADRLGRQFQMLETMSAISRAILSSYESHDMVEVVLTRTPEALSCDAVGVALFQTDQGTDGTLSTRYFFGNRNAEQHRLATTEEDRGALKAQPHHLLVSGSSVPSYLGAFMRNGLSMALILPINVQEDCAGVMVLGYCEAGDPPEDDISHGRQLADQVSVALSNTQEIARRVQADAKAHFLVNYDPLTRLANRQRFEQSITEALSLEGDSRHGAVLLINLDRFQRVNDTFGPQAGDRVLQTMAARLEHAIKQQYKLSEQTMAARFGNDQFGILLTRLLSDEEPARIGQVLLQSVGVPCQIGDTQIVLTASLGVALLHRDGEDADLLIRNADTAMRAAKEKGRNILQFYSGSMNRALAARLALEQQLRNALDREEFLLHYQPKVEVSSGVIVGVEALIRWQHPERGLVTPAEFIPVAEEDESVIVALGEWILRAACKQQQAWSVAGWPSLDIAVNISSLQFRRPDFVECLETILRETGANPRALELEMTETVLMNDSKSAIATLNRLRAMGIRLAMDDFGTGYSSLAYLRHFPIDTIKIDRAFVQAIFSESEGGAIAAAIIAMGHALKLHVLAEGVETQAQLSFLRELGCHSFQGFLFSKPLPVDGMTNLLRIYPRSYLAKSA